MIRPFTAVCMLVAGASGLFLYQAKHQTGLLDRQIMSLIKQTDAVRERMGVLRAEWALLNEPERLAELSGKHLGLRTLAPTQFTAVADLGNRLPLPGAFALPVEEPVAAIPPVAPPAAVPPAAVAAAAPRMPARPAQAAAAMPPPAGPVQTASAAPARPVAPPKAPRTGRDEPAPAQAAARQVQVASLPPPVLAPRPLAPVVNVAAAAIQAPRMPVTAVGQPASYGQPPLVQSALGQSALGGARAALPPPVPFGAAQVR